MRSRTGGLYRVFELLDADGANPRCIKQRISRTGNALGRPAVLDYEFEELIDKMIGKTRASVRGGKPPSLQTAWG